MSLSQATLGWLCIGLEALLLTGLVTRRRVRQCYSLPVLFVAWLSSALVAALQPENLTWEFWNVTEMLHALLGFVLGGELAWRAFRHIPRAWWCARVLSVAAVSGGGLLVWAAHPGPVAVRVVPWLLAALAWLYVGLWTTARWIGMPQERLHAAVLAGLSPYLVIYAMTWGQTETDTRVANLLNPFMFMISLLPLVRAAWAREVPVRAHPETVRWLFPWRS